MCLRKMRCKWSRHIMRCWSRDEEINAPQKMWWRSFLRWGTVKVKILMIRFENKTWLMENQVKLSSSGDITAVILMLTWSKSVQIWQQRDTKRDFTDTKLYTFNHECNRFNSKVLIMFIIYRPFNQGKLEVTHGQTAGGWVGIWAVKLAWSGWRSSRLSGHTLTKHTC